MAEEKSYQQMRKEFQDAFFTQISPQLEEHESDRKGQLLMACIISGVLGTIGLVFLFLLFYVLCQQRPDAIAFQKYAVIAWLTLFFCSWNLAFHEKIL